MDFYKFDFLLFSFSTIAPKQLKVRKKLRIEERANDEQDFKKIYNFTQKQGGNASST